MSNKTTLAAGTSPFAHLLGGAAALAGRAIGKKAENETPPTQDGPKDPDDAIDGTPVDDEGKGKKGKGKKAEGDQPDPDAEDDDVDPDAEEPEDEEQAKAYRAGVAAANARGAAIFGSAAAAGRPDLAAQLTFGSRMTSAEAIAFLAAANAAPTGRISALDELMVARRDPRPGADSNGGDGTKPSLASRISAAKTKAGMN